MADAEEVQRNGVNWERTSLSVYWESSLLFHPLALLWFWDFPDELVERCVGQWSGKEESIISKHYSQLLLQGHIRAGWEQLWPVALGMSKMASPQILKTENKASPTHPLSNRNIMLSYVTTSATHRMWLSFRNVCGKILSFFLHVLTSKHMLFNKIPLCYQIFSEFLLP